MTHTCKSCSRYPRHGYVMWAAVIGGSLLVEAEALRHGKYEHTLSYATRYVFKTHTPVGAAALVTGWGALTWWFIPHIIKGVNTVSQALADITTTEELPNA